jgi:hypothetical protein
MGRRLRGTGGAGARPRAPRRHARLLECRKRALLENSRSPVLLPLPDQEESTHDSSRSKRPLFVEDT